MEDFYTLITIFSTLFFILLTLFAIFENKNLFIGSLITLLMFYFSFNNVIKAAILTEELYKLKKEEELEFLDVDSSGEMLIFCNSTQINKQYHKKIINSKRPFLKIEFELMKERYLELENELNYEKLYNQENTKEYNL